MYIRFEAVHGCPDAWNRFLVFDSRMHDVSNHVGEVNLAALGVSTYSTRTVPFIGGWSGAIGFESNTPAVAEVAVWANEILVDPRDSVSQRHAKCLRPKLHALDRHGEGDWCRCGSRGGDPWPTA